MSHLRATPGAEPIDHLPGQMHPSELYNLPYLSAQKVSRAIILRGGGNLRSEVQTPAAEVVAHVKPIWRTQKMITVERTSTTMAVSHDNFL